MTTTLINGQLEIDHDRGVIYFHTADFEAWETITVLRICSLPTPVPKKFIDITHMVGVNYNEKPNAQ